MSIYLSMTHLVLMNFLKSFLLQVERLSEYDRYFASLLVDTHPDHPDYTDLQRHSEHLAQVSTNISNFN